MSKQELKAAGDELVADLDAHGVTHERQVAYWVGVTPQCPVPQINCGGLNFPKINELLIPRPGFKNEKQRVPVIGGLVRDMTADKLAALREILPRLVIRFTEDAGTHEEPGTGKNIGDAHMRTRKGFVITIPTEEAVKDANARGIAIRRYVHQPNDEPAARYMFLTPCADQNEPRRGEVYPATLDKTGLVWHEAGEPDILT